MIRRAAIFFVLAMTAATFVHAQAADEKELLQVQAARWKAVMANDVKALATILADEMDWVNSAGAVELKPAYLERIGNGRTKWTSIVPESMKVKVYGNTAILYGRINQTVVTVGRTEANHEYSQTVEVYVKRDGRWQLTHFQGTHPPQPPSPAK